MLEFPEGFLWGAATAAYQVEGGNTNADWWHWEQASAQRISSGQACQHYRRYREDLDIARELSHSCHRLSLEWSRIQPRQNHFSQEAIEHYREVIAYVRRLGIEPVVTLHHFTNPQWFAELGGWANPHAAHYFMQYVRKVVEALSEKVTYWVSVNEPMVYVYTSFIAGRWPPQERSVWRAQRVLGHLCAGHCQAYRLIHELYARKNLKSPQVSIAHNMVAFVACTGTLRDRLVRGLRDWSFNRRLIGYLVRRRALDYIGVNYYTRHLIDTQRWSFDEMVNNACRRGHDTLPKNTMNWEVYPQGLFDLLVGLKRYRLPVFILENGICAADDRQRWEYIRDHVRSVWQALQQGVDVRGYLYWSLLDNFEWDWGFGPRFGLCEVDYEHDCRRTIRESARKFAQVCATNKLQA